ncbi:hypothetical protein EV360DRAFT_53908 [Lentinula raphanica]|nr:hypothetical protein EV360DRAFT_53908 [Lentinula raphanica]
MLSILLSSSSGYLTATASEDWTLVLEVCDRASSNEANAKEAVKALRREFKYGPPGAQLSAARLWAIMLRNSSDVFITQCTSRKFLDTLEDLLTSTGRTSPVVRERVMDVLAAAAYASGSSESDTGFRGLWKKVKPADKPDEGVPFDTDDAMFNPPAFSASGRGSYHEVTPPSAAVQHDSTNEGRHKDHREHKEKKSKNRIIPLEEDIRRLFQECTIGLANASLLNQALGHAKVEELKKGEVIKEFRVKCLASQELIATQIPWATAGAERSRKEREREKALLYGENPDTVRKSKERNRDRSLSQLADAAGVTGADSPVDEQTTEEKLLAALLEANGELLGALGQFDDLERVAIERKAEKKSRKELKMDRKQQQQLNEITASSGAGAVESVIPLRTSRSPSPASHRGSRPSSMVVQHPLPQHPSSLLTHPIQQHIASQNSLSNHSPEFPATTLAPPRAPPHGPRSPASGHGHGHTRTGSSGYPPSRTPSPNTPIIDYSSSGNAAWSVRKSMDESSDEEILTPIKPSAKALGKRRVDVTDEPDNAYYPDGRPRSRNQGLLHQLRHPPVHFVYDAAAERTQQRIREMELQNQMERSMEVGNVH